MRSLDDGLQRSAESCYASGVEQPKFPWALAAGVLITAMFLGVWFDRRGEALLLGLSVVFLFSLRVKPGGMTFYQFLASELRRHRDHPSQ